MMKRHFGFKRARAIAAGALVAIVVAGLIFKIGSGTPSAFGIDQIAAICPLGALETMFGAKEFMLHPVILLAAMVVVVALVGKAFCAWGCPIPWLQRFLRPKKKASPEKSHHDGRKDAKCEASLPESAEIREKSAQIGAIRAEKIAPDETEARISLDSVHGDGILRKENGTEGGGDCAHERAAAIEGACAAGTASLSNGCASCGHACKLAPVGGARDGVQLDTRHAVLAGTLASAAVFGFPVFCLVCPVGLTFATIIGLWHLLQFNEPSWALVVFPIILLLELTVLRKWCSKICPISALTSLIANANVTLRPRVDSQACLREKGVDCHACIDVCPENLDPHTGRIPECSKCGACVEACPAHAIKFKLLK